MNQRQLDVSKLSTGSAELLALSNVKQRQGQSRILNIRAATYGLIVLVRNRALHWDWTGKADSGSHREITAPTRPAAACSAALLVRDGS